jgi:hypothetical protein
MGTETLDRVRVTNVRTTGQIQAETPGGESYRFSISDVVYYDREQLGEIAAVCVEWVGGVTSAANRNGEKYPFEADIKGRNDKLATLEIRGKAIGTSEYETSLRNAIMVPFMNSSSVSQKPP